MICARVTESRSAARIARDRKWCCHHLSGEPSSLTSVGTASTKVVSKGSLNSAGAHCTSNGPADASSLACTAGCPRSCIARHACLCMLACSALVGECRRMGIPPAMKCPQEPSAVASTVVCSEAFSFHRSSNALVVCKQVVLRPSAKLATDTVLRRSPNGLDGWLARW